MKALNLIRRIIFFSSIAIIGLWLIVNIVGSCITLQLTGGYDSTYNAFQVFGIPIAILCTLTGTIRRGNRWPPVLTKVILQIIVSFAVFVMIFDATFTFCNYDIDRILFRDKAHPSYRIVQRSYGCGAVDSAPPSHHFYRVRHLAPHLYWIIEPVDTTAIDRSIWERVQGSPAR